MNIKPQVLTYKEVLSKKDSNPELIIHDAINIVFEDLFDIKYPSKKDKKTEKDITDFVLSYAGPDTSSWGNWILFPWSNLVVHFPPKDELRELRTSRNKNLVTADEQARLYKSNILIAGMSVGSNIVEALVSQGIGGMLVLIDMDTIEPSNLNRIRSPYHHVGLTKTEAISRKAWEIDPYLEIIQINEGVTEENLPLLTVKHDVDVFVDEMDDLKMKLFMREIAKKHKIPVVMAADDGDNSLLDIERYDLHQDLEIFGGSIPEDVQDKIKSGNLSRPEQGALIGKYFVGFDNVPLRMFESLTQVGVTLPSWPQLGGAAALSGVAVAYIIKKILLGEDIVEGRTLLSLDEKIDLEHKKTKHIEALNDFKAKFI